MLWFHDLWELKKGKQVGRLRDREQVGRLGGQGAGGGRSGETSRTLFKGLAFAMEKNDLESL